MKIKNAFKIFFKNYTLVLKVAVTQLVFVAIIFGLGAFIASDMIVGINSGLVEFGIIEKLNVVISEISSGNFDAQRFNLLITELERTIFVWGAGVEYFYQKVAASVVIIFVTIVLSSYLMGLYVVPFNQNIHDFMSTSAKIPYVWRFVKSLGKSAKTQLVQMCFPFLLDVFILLGTWGIYTSMLSLLGLPGIILAVVIGIVFITLRKTLFAFWVPAMVINEMPVKASMKEGFKLLADCFCRVFWRILTSVLITLALVVILLFGATNIWTLLLAVFIMLHGELLIATVCMVEYYNQSNFGFYVDQMHTVEAEQ